MHHCTSIMLTRTARGLSDILNIIAAAPLSERAKQLPARFSSRWARPKPRSTMSTSTTFTFTKSARPTPSSTLSAPPSARKRSESSSSSARRSTLAAERVACAHGVLPVPAPATLELLHGAPIYSGEIQKELVTPTGAAIVKVLVSSFGPRPMMTPTRSATAPARAISPGTRTSLRISVGETQENALADRQLPACRRLRGRDCDSGSQPRRPESAAHRLHHGAGVLPKARSTFSPRRCR